MNVQSLLKARWALSIGFSAALFNSIWGCDLEDRRQAIKKYQLENELKIGQVLHLSSLLNTSDGDICILYPYHDDVVKEVPQSTRINTYLQASGYVTNESRWAFIIVEPEKIKRAKFKRSEKLDILASHEIQQEHKTQLPPGFVPTDCAPLAHAVLTKIASHNQIYLIMGEMK